MRLHSAELVSRTTANWDGVSAEIVDRRFGARPAELYTLSTRHAVYVELTDGIVCEREVVGFHSHRYISRMHLLSFRPAGSTLRGTASGSGIHSYGVVFIDPECEHLRQPLAQIGNEWTPFTALRNQQIWDEMAPLLAECAAADARKRPLARFYAVGRAIALLALLADETGQASYAGSGDRRVRSALAWIHDNLTHEFTLEHLADVANTSASQLVRLFRKSLGLTPMAYVSQRRIREAQRLLASSSMSVEQIAIHLGYSDQSHFTNRFRANTGVTPAVFRRERRA
ncbi:AraC family transcriptional regulator [Paraburkholderia edwinii]|uniref:AraC family transcriptional regulator n=1 Tax=Paraburkholderia edwinii TaxID=2861782 RepID=A0ABX8UUI7_9BURK|nr:AraC family transcriptional regulator [Paraburkholderia edwinii]QYD72666.1 AraC family transcriptional regulator [Paraburkholderia edwinii]